MEQNMVTLIFSQMTMTYQTTQSRYNDLRTCRTITKQNSYLSEDIKAMLFEMQNFDTWILDFIFIMFQAMKIQRWKSSIHVYLF